MVEKWINHIIYKNSFHHWMQDEKNEDIILDVLYI